MYDCNNVTKACHKKNTKDSYCGAEQSIEFLQNCNIADISYSADGQGF